MKRYKSLFRPSTLMFVVSVAVVAFYAISSKPQRAQISQGRLERGHSPRIQIKDQPDSPLGILSVRGDSATLHVPRVELVVVNKSIQPVRAYTLRYQTISGHSKGGGMELTSASSIDSVLQPGHTAFETIGEGTSYSDLCGKDPVNLA